jgi:hypothetical protein
MSNSPLEKLPIVPINKTFVFYSPMESPKGKEVLVRTGTISDGSCFFHALLHAYSKDYVSMSYNGRKKFVSRLRASLARKMDKSRWEGLSNGLIAKISFQENVSDALNEFYRFISRSKSGRTRLVRKLIRKVVIKEKDIDPLKIIMEMISLQDFEKTILPEAYEKTEDKSIDVIKKEIVKESMRFCIKKLEKIEGISDKEIGHYVLKLQNFTENLVNVSENEAYKEYIESLHDSSMEIDSYMIKLISNKFDRDIYFLDSRTRMPYKEDETKENIKGRTSVIVMWTGGCHYEIVGRLLRGDRVQREFDSKDPLIKRFYTFLYNPKKIPGEYPHLIHYLSKEIRSELGYDIEEKSYGKSSDNDPFSSDEEKSSEYQRSDSEYSRDDDYSNKSQESESNDKFVKDEHKDKKESKSGEDEVDNNRSGEDNNNRYGEDEVDNNRSGEDNNRSGEDEVDNNKSGEDEVNNNKSGEKVLLQKK